MGDRYSHDWVRLNLNLQVWKFPVTTHFQERSLDLGQYTKNSVQGSHDRPSNRESDAQAVETLTLPPKP